MKLIDFAKLAGVKFIRCEATWGGTWGFINADQENCQVLGYKSKKAALEGWFADTFSGEILTAVKRLLEESEAKLTKT